MHTGQSERRASASSDQGLTSTQLCSVESQANFTDFHHFQACYVDFELITAKLFKSNARYPARFKGNVCSFPFQGRTLGSVMLCSEQNCLGVLIHRWTHDICCFEVMLLSREAEKWSNPHLFECVLLPRCFSFGLHSNFKWDFDL